MPFDELDVRPGLGALRSDSRNREGRSMGRKGEEGDNREDKDARVIDQRRIERGDEKVVW